MSNMSRLSFRYSQPRCCDHCTLSTTSLAQYHIKDCRKKSSFSPEPDTQLERIQLNLRDGRDDATAVRVMPELGQVDT
jgi:hypothetical protein